MPNVEKFYLTNNGLRGRGTVYAKFDDGSGWALIEAYHGVGWIWNEYWDAEVASAALRPVSSLWVTLKGLDKWLVPRGSTPKV